MKNVLTMFKNKTSEGSHSEDFSDSNVKSTNISKDFDDFDELDDFTDLESEDDNNDVFEDFTDKVQSLLDQGAESLEIAEVKTSQLEDLDPESEDYEKMVEEVKAAQSDARQYFDDAEFLIKKANEILEKK